MIRLLAACVLLIVLAIVAGTYLHFSPAIPIFVIVSVGFCLWARTGGEFWPQSLVQWRSGHGIYLRADDPWVAGSDPNDTAETDGPGPEHR
ncbi:MAG TPA: hypothetical protein VMR17_25675 [Xanthobacteraceae bacterium]|jgi:hypothetical protein|nr:hypothetical protein [Xanthobacteraceae bacterium]